ncbi:NAD(P)/FAD-dependent oxidoreductase [Anabaena subtropica]|uniref:Tryptophan 7-halogenase n=1 Tax=Anabaena subtropica FACHB-260 TaxID=2692884 RepID=A0ABR8CHY9_9NOST|nr:tryptophan 7-halogenase [Anabaena subtropica]MBD2342817.1 tryptophan 7-halogenase [Anabaena subtropica FACHB-260]
MNPTQELVYDVVIMGAGFAGNCQARHLLLKNPNIKIAIVDPRSPERTAKDLKVGESTVEIGATFLSKELGLHEYLIENHSPKHGLNFHWAKNPDQTDSIDDYYHVGNRTVPIDTFQLNRAKLEQDLLQMNRDMGAIFYNGRVVDVELTPKDELHTVQVKLEENQIDLKAKHLIDAAGRRFIIGKKTDNLIFDPEQLYGINTGSAWLRVKNIDRSIIDNGYHPNSSVASRFYATHHWFGHGHWIWMIPIDKQEKELSIGIVYHKNIIPSQEINTLEKFTNFLKANHAVVSNLIESGELVDFNHLPRLAHNSKKIISEDNWYVLGDAAQMFDPFYSPGLTLTALAIESTTDIICSQLAGEADIEQKQEFYNNFLLINSRTYNQIYQKHDKHLGDASVMSWRIYMENMFWFGILVPMYIGKWFLDFDFISQYQKIANFIFFGKNSIFTELYEIFDKLVERKINIGVVDYTRADQFFWNYSPTKMFDKFLENTKFEALRCNVFAGMKATFFFLIFYYLKLRFKGFGILGVLSPRCIFRVLQLFGLYIYVAMGEQIYLFKTRNLPDNSLINQMREEFKNYQYQPELQPWF